MIASDLAPSDGEAAVLSFVASRDDSGWVMACGSLLTVPIGIAHTSWQRWGHLQPATRVARYDHGGFDVGPVFAVEPFDGVLAARAVVDRSDWTEVVAALGDGYVRASLGRCRVTIKEWSSTVFLGSRGATSADMCVVGLKRPITGVVANLDAPPIAPTKDTWVSPVAPGLRPGPELAAVAPHRRLLHWPIHMLGIDWSGLPEHAPEPRLVVGRAHTDAWLVTARPDYDNGDFHAVIGWDEQRVDPLSCSLLMRSELNGLPVLTRHVRVTDLPSHSPAAPEPRRVSWRHRTLDVRLPLGPRRAVWSVALLSPSGRLLDERPAVPRYVRISLAMHIGGSDEPSRVVVSGDREEPPDASENDDAVAAAIELERAARRAAAKRRISNSGALEDYLRWRFSCRDGELCVLDPYLLHGAAPVQATVIAFLERLDRPVRALTSQLSQRARSAVRAAPAIDVRELLPADKLHDRVWMLGDTAVLVGTSISSFLAHTGGRTTKTTTATELPDADAAHWRDQFETWWRLAR